MTNLFLQLISKDRPIIADGAMGTNLFNLGLETGSAPELWNESNPDKIKKVYADFINAGSDIILTNSFGSNSYRLKLHAAENRAFELSEAAATLAMEVANELSTSNAKRACIGGSMGPLGEILKPYGSLSFPLAFKSFLCQAQGLKSGGADVLWVETMSSTLEAGAAILAGAVVGLPVVCTMTFDTAGKTMMGVSPSDAALNLGQTALLEDICDVLAADKTKLISKDSNGKLNCLSAIGANCGITPSDTLFSVMEMLAASPDITAVIKANCGIPQYKDGQFTYSGTDELMADYAKLSVDAGVKIIGGCCGSTPATVRAIANAIKNHKVEPITQEKIISRLGKPQIDLNAPNDKKPKRRSRRRG